MSERWANPKYLVDTGWLAGHLGDARVRVFDCTTFLLPDPVTTFRVQSARPEWEEGHVPGAGYIDIQGELSDRASRLRFTFPTAEQFAAAMSAHGLGPGLRAVLYSAKTNWWATRVWWMLRAFGFDDAAVLDGGWEKWLAEGRPVCTTPCAPPPARFEARLRPELLARKDDVRAAMTDRRVVVVNALSHGQHTGESSIHYGRPGHIPGSANVPFGDLIDRDSNTFLSPERLRARLDGVGAGDSRRIITYCGGGIAATGVAFALALLGRDDVAVYDASLSEWAADPTLPMETA